LVKIYSDEDLLHKLITDMKAEQDSVHDGSAPWMDLKAGGGMSGSVKKKTQYGAPDASVNVEFHDPQSPKREELKLSEQGTARAAAQFNYHKVLQDPKSTAMHMSRGCV